MLAEPRTAEGAPGEHGREVSSGSPGPLVPFPAPAGPHALLKSLRPDCF